MPRPSRFSALLARLKLGTKHRLESTLWRAGLDVSIRRAKGGHHTRTERDHQWLRDLELGTVLDIGAHVGAHAEIFLELFPRARVYAFEPVPEVFRAMIDRLGSCERFAGFNVALGAENGEMTFHQSAAAETSSLLAMAAEHKTTYPHAAETWETEVAVRTLDSLRGELILEEPVLAKIDVQGGELAVLDGAADTLGDVDVIIIETSFTELYEGQPLFDRVYDRLTGRGFRYAGSFNQLLHPSTRRVLQQDAIFIRTDDGR